jgi:uncharacterized protein with PQ loop repeat
MAKHNRRLLNVAFRKEDMRTIDQAMWLVSIINPLVAIPQAVVIYVNQDATNVSLVTWLSFMLVGVVLTFYSLAHRIKPMIINQILWFAVDIAIIVGILMYG